MIGAVAIVIGLAIFAATDSPDLPWIAPIIGGGPFGLGMVLIFLSTMSYLTDAYLIYAASVLASNSVIRSLFGFAFPLFTTDMYQIGGKNGIHWGPAIAGLLALICLPFPFIFYKYGAHIRERCKYASEAKQMLEQMQSSSKAKQPAQAAKQDDVDLEGGEKTARTDSNTDSAKAATTTRPSLEVDPSTQAHTPTMSRTRAPKARITARAELPLRNAFATKHSIPHDHSTHVEVHTCTLSIVPYNFARIQQRLKAACGVQRLKHSLVKGEWQPE